MNLFGFCGMALISVTAVLIIKELKPSLAPVSIALFGVVTAGYIIVSLTPVIEFLKQLTSLTGDGLIIMLKALGIALISQTTGDICRDCGESTFALRVETAGKCAILLLSLPLLRQIIQMAGEIVN